MWRLLIQQASHTLVPEGEEREQRPTRRSSFRRMGNNLDGYIRREPILCALHRRLLQAHLDLPDAAKERSVRTLPKIRKRSRKDDRSTCTKPSIGWRQGVLLGWFHDIPPKGRNSTKIHLSTHTIKKRCSRAQESAHPRSSASHDEGEAHAEVILGWSCEYDRLPHEPVHNIRSARGHAAWKIIRKDAGVIAHTDIQRDRLCAYSQR